MSKEYLSKTFKSGNSVALRLPKALGVPEGTQMRLREEQGHFVVEPAESPKRKFNVDKVWGCAAGSGLSLIAPEDRVFDQRALLWDEPSQPSA